MFVYIFIAFLAFVVLALALFILFLQKKIKGGKDIDIAGNINSQIQLLSQSFSSSLNNIQKSVDQRLGENTNRLDNAARSYGEVQKQLVHLQGEVKRVHEVGKDISSLHEILRAPKNRGVMGEIWLEKLLSQMLPQEHFDLQHAFKSGEKVDAVIMLQNYLISVDSKFPLENFQKASQAQDETEKKNFQKQEINFKKKLILSQKS